MTSAVLIGVSNPDRRNEFFQAALQSSSELFRWLRSLKCPNLQVLNSEVRKYNEEGRWFPPASQLAELIWVSCHRGKLRWTKVPVKKQQTNQKTEKPERDPKKYRNTKAVLLSKILQDVWPWHLKVHSERGFAVGILFLQQEMGKKIKFL